MKYTYLQEIYIYMYNVDIMQFNVLFFNILSYLHDEDWI